MVALIMTVLSVLVVLIASGAVITVIGLIKVADGYEDSEGFHTVPSEPKEISDPALPA